MVNQTTLEGFYAESTATLPEGIAKEIGHFNVFETEKLFNKKTGERTMPYSRRAYYKISWIHGQSRAEYADKVIEIEQDALLFATPRIPYHYVPANFDQAGLFCIFTADFLTPKTAGVMIDDLPIFQPGQLPIFKLSPDNVEEVRYIFHKMQRELNSDYKYKYDLLRTLLLELIHYGQKLQPMSAFSNTQNASQRISSLFIELLERQFPLEWPNQRLSLRSPKDYADRLAVHVNHLNKVLKEITGSTTSEIISRRIIQEAKILLKQTTSAVAEIAYMLGFEDVAHFSNYFKKQTSVSPMEYRHPL